MPSIAQALVDLIGVEGVSLWADLDEDTQRRLSSALLPDAAADASLECVVYPATQTELAAVMGSLHQQGVRSLFLGRGSKLPWGGLARGVQVAVSTARLNRLVEHAEGDLTVTAEAGMRLADLQQVLAQKGQFLAIDPSYAHSATLGGIVATADSGPLRHRYGGVRDMLIGITLVRADGAIAKAGGRVVKNVAGYDLMKLFTGSWGTLGALSQMTFRVYPLPETSQTVVLTGATESLAQAAQTLLNSALTPTAIEWIAAPLAQTLGLGQDISLMVRFQSLPVGVETQVARLLQMGQSLGLQGKALEGAAETALWKQLRETWEAIAPAPAITCKIGILPSHVATTLDKLSHLLPGLEFGAVHAGTGIGLLRLPADGVTAATLQTLRQLCQSQGGYLSILEAPTALKQNFDVWGYSGNALPLMQDIKRQFDPQNLLSPGRFLREG